MAKVDILGLQAYNDYDTFEIDSLTPSWWFEDEDDENDRMSDLLCKLQNYLTDDFNIDAFKALLLEAYQKPQWVPTRAEVSRRTAKEVKVDYNSLDPFTKAHLQDFDAMFLLKGLSQCTDIPVEGMPLWKRFDKDLNRHKITFSIPSSQRDQLHVIWLDTTTGLHRDAVTGETIYIGWIVNMSHDFVQHHSDNWTVSGEVRKKAGLQRHLMVIALMLDTRAFRPGQDDKFCKRLDRDWVHASGIRFANDMSWPKGTLKHTRDVSDDSDAGSVRITKGMKALKV